MSPKGLAKEPTDQARNGTAVVGVARSAAEGEQFAAVVDDQMQLEAVEPAYRRLAAPGVHGKDAVLVDAGGMAHRPRGRVDEANAATLPQLGMEVDGERDEEARHEFDKVAVAQNTWKLLAQVDLDVLGGEPFEGALPDCWKRMRMVRISAGCRRLRGDGGAVLRRGVRVPTQRGSKRGQKAAKRRPPSSTGRVYSYRCLQIRDDGS